MVPTHRPDAEPVGRFDLTAFEEPSVAVMEAISELLDVDPLEVTPLYQAIDPDALERLFKPRSTARTFEGIVQFEYHDHWVRIDSDGSGRIYEQEPSLLTDGVQSATSADD